MNTENIGLQRLLDDFARVVTVCEQKTVWRGPLNFDAHGAIAAAHGVLVLGRMIAALPACDSGSSVDTRATQEWAQRILDRNVQHRIATAQVAQLLALTAVVALAITGHLRNDSAPIAAAQAEIDRFGPRLARGSWVGVV